VLFSLLLISVEPQDATTRMRPETIPKTMRKQSCVRPCTTSRVHMIRVVTTMPDASRSCICRMRVCFSAHIMYQSHLHSAHRLESTLGPSTMSRQRSEESIVLFGGFEVDISQFDLGDRSSRVSSVQIANIIFIILVVLTVSLRIFARVKYVRRIFADDGTCVGLGRRVWLTPTSSHHLCCDIHRRSGFDLHCW
jgi:hypothetical protein